MLPSLVKPLAEHVACGQNWSDAFIGSVFVIILTECCVTRHFSSPSTLFHHLLGLYQTGTFDPHALKNPEVLQRKWLYQKGINYSFANTKAYVLTRDGYTCQQCKGKSKDRRLEVHHIVFRSEQGSDEETNLVTLCKICHDRLHTGTITLKQQGAKKGTLLHATQMNSIRIQLLKRVAAEETWGFVTKEHRHLAGLPKDHIFDASIIATRGTTPVFQTRCVLMKKCVPDGDYQQTKGIGSEQPIPTGKIAGFRKFDKVRYARQEYFIKGRMTTGYAILMDISGNKLALKLIPKCDKMKRVSARSSWMMVQKTIPSLLIRPSERELDANASLAVGIQSFSSSPT